jgi:membrane-associated phospholipid phosphatase
MSFELFLSAALRYILAWDQWWLININSIWTSPGEDNLFPLFSQWNQNAIIVVCFVGLGIYWSLREEKNGWKITLLAVLSTILSQVAAQQLAQSVIKRPSPKASTTLTLQLRVPSAPTYSCPSTAAATAAAVGTILFLTSSGLTTFLALSFPLLVAYSGAYAGTHFPSDGIAGLLLGYFIARFVWNMGGHWAQFVEYEDRTQSRLKRYARTPRNPTGS